MPMPINGLTMEETQQVDLVDAGMARVCDPKILVAAIRRLLAEKKAWR